MFGTLRLILAVLVATSHLQGGVVGGVWIGVSAVVVFFMISGYAMTGLIQSRFTAPGSAALFYKERFIRLAPQYYLWLAVALFITLGLHWAHLNMAGFIPAGLLEYLTVMPMGLQWYLFIQQTHVMPQVTTLGIEITFYVFSPWILRNRYLAALATLVGLSMFGMTAAGYLPVNIYTYYQSPGPIVFFMLGHYLYRHNWKALSVSTGILAAIMVSGPMQHFNLDYLVGMALGLPSLLVLRRYRSTKLDAALGNASYGCFLSHTTFIYAAMHFTGTEDPAALPAMIKVAVVILGSLAGYASYVLVERPTLKFRRRLRATTAASYT